MAGGITEEQFAALIENYDEKSVGEYYIVDNDDIIIEVIEPAWATDRNGNHIETYYKLEDIRLVQIVEFDGNSKFPIIADPTVGETKSFSYKVSNSTMGDLSTYVSAGATLSVAARKAAAKLGRKKLLKITGSKLIPGAGAVSTFVAVLATINNKTGKKGIEFYGSVQYTKHTNHKEGITKYLWGIRSLKVRRY